MKIDEVRRNAFYQFPKWLDDEPYCQMSDRAKLMYMRLWDRRKLSLKNQWYDENGDVFVYYKNEELKKKLRCGENSVIKTKNELSDFGLLKEVRQGINMPNKLYIGTVKNTGQELEKLQYGTVKNTGQELEKLQSNKTNNNNTELVRLIEPDVVPAGTLYSNSTIGRALKENGLHTGQRQQQQLLEFVGRKNMSFDMIIRAIEITGNKAERPSVDYVLSILNGWEEKGFTSLEQVEEHERQRKQPKQQQEYDGIGNIPEWSSMHPDNVEKSKKEDVYDPERWKKWLKEKKNGR